MEEEKLPEPSAETVLSNDESLETHLSSLEAKHLMLSQEKAKMEEDFSMQRAKLKELYLQKEGELRSKSEENTAYIVEIEDLKYQLHTLQTELDEARSEVTVAQCTAENEVAVERRKCEEEIASIQQIMREEITSANTEIQHLRVYAEKLKQEKLYYRGLYEKIIEDSDLKKEGLLSPNVLSAVTKSIAKRVPSLSPAHSPNLSSGDKLPHSHLAPSAGAPSSSGGATTPDTENLEDSMKRAQEDAAVLRSLVVPLEEEIRALKDKLREQDAQLRTHESQEQMAIRTADVLAPLFQGKSAEELVQELDEKLQGVQNTLEVEKASRADLELYTAILNTQKTALSDQIDRLREQQADLRQTYDEERKEHNDLKNTWQRANDEFLESQRVHLEDMRNIHSILTSEQLRKFYDMQQLENRTEDGTPILNLGRGTENKKLSAEPDARTPLLEKSSSQEDVEKPSSDDTTSTRLESCDTLEGQDENVTKATATLLSKYSPEKMPQLTDDQKRALSAISSEKMGQSASLSTSGQENSPIHLNASQRRVVSEVEWCRLQEEIKRSRLKMSIACPMCPGFESQLKKVQSDLKESEKGRSKLEKSLGRHREDLDREALYRKQTEAQWKQKAEEYDRREKDLQVMVDKLSGRHSQIVSWSKNTVHVMEEKLKRLAENREAAYTELTRLQRENDNLVGKHSQHSQELQNEIINLPDTMEGMQLLLLRYREDVIAAKVAKEQLEEKSNSKILFLKDQILKEQHEKSSMEDMLSAEIEQLKKKITSLEKKESQLEGEMKHRTEAETKLTEVERKARDSTLKSQQMISSLKQKVDEQTHSSSRHESEILELRGRVASLQHDLEMSEAVQRDFVRLSQSLQVQLEKIRQSEKEVRWQHEDDIEECSHCRQRFTAVGRRKNHCKHCGKIFCSDCVSKTVPSGPNGRTSRVCDVCHTLLVQDATPFFSREPPQSPD